MRKALSIFLLVAGGLATIASGISGHLMEDQRRHIAYNYLLVSIGFVIIGVVLGVIHIWFEPNPNKAAKLQRIKRGERRAFGVYWDSDLHPLCPICRTPLTLSTRNLIYRIDPFNNSIPPPQPIPHCLKCDKALPLYDDDGNHITLGEAKKLLSPKEPKPEIEIETPKPEPLQLQTSGNLQTSDDYKPNKIAIEILKQIDKQVAYESELARVLNLEPKQLRNSLGLLEKHKYIRLHRPANLAPHYQLTQKGIDLLNKPVYTAPLPHSYEPDETSTKILLLLSDRDVFPDALTLSQRLWLNIERVKYILEELVDRQYVTETQFMHGDSEYSLTKKGRKFLIDKGLI
jgi:predicted transcriptional regulator